MSSTPVLERSSSCREVGRWFDDVARDLDQVRATDRSAATDEERLAWVEQVRGLQRRVDALAAMLIAEADEAGSAMRARHTHLQDWLARSGQETPRQATATLWAARELERRPQVRDAAASGQISLGQAKAINTALDGLPSKLDRSQLKEAVDLMLAAADHAPAETLRGMSERVLSQVAPEKSETPEARAERLTQRDVRASARRCLRFGAECDGSLEFSGSLPVVDGRRLQHLVQTIADRGYRAAKDAHDRRSLAATPQQRLADALVTVVTVGEARSSRRGAAVVGDPAGPAIGSPLSVGSIPDGATRISVVISVDELLDRATARGLLTDGTSLSPGELRRLACSAELIPVVLGRDSTVLDVGFAHRLAPAALRLAVGLRDGGCAFPGCSAPLEHCDIHHVTPWQEGGATTLSNLVALCRSHHTLVEPGPPARRPDGTLERVDQWEARIDGRGLPEFLPPVAMDPQRAPVRRRASHVQELLETG
ncbi:MAG: DUF222 domain-containing protein [Actinobacteria bacterium]|nr:DUF222 domain-containing protein [Actinomycetota bacterium]